VRVAEHVDREGDLGRAARRIPVRAVGQERRSRQRPGRVHDDIRAEAELVVTSPPNRRIILRSCTSTAPPTCAAPASPTQAKSSAASAPRAYSSYGGSGPDFSVLRRTPRRICVVSGSSKLPSLRGALSAGLITDLFVDEGTARALISAP